MRFRQLDAIALAAVPLVVAAFWTGGAVLPTICLCLAGAIVVHVIAGHDELAWRHRFAASTVVFAGAVGMVVYLYRVNLPKELKQQVVPLVAAALPPPVSRNCPVPKGAVALYLGNAVSVITEFPHVVLRVHGEDVFILYRDAAGLVVNFTVLDDGGKVVGRLSRNVFKAINPGSHVERPSASSLALLDDRDSKVLDVQFLNPQAIQITGTLRYPGVDPIVIGEKYLGIGGSIAQPVCRSGAEVDFLFN